MEKLLNLIFIPNCLFCKTQGAHFCSKCIDQCKQLPLKITSLPTMTCKFLFIYEYKGFIRECIRISKYKNKHFAALKNLTKSVLASQDVHALLESFIKGEKCLVVPIPVSRAKLKSRGFNQAELIAQNVADSLKIKYETKLLVRSKETTAQFTNTRKERFENMKNAFDVNNPTKIAATKIILVDDVCTTGATFIEATKLLLKSGASKVLCFSLAHKSLTKKFN